MSDLRRHAFVAVGSSWALSLAQDVIRLVTMMVLARLLVPEDYGHFALATSITGWLTGVGFLNFAPQLLRERGEPGELATYLLFGLALQTALAVLGLAVAAMLWFVWDRRLVGALVALAVLALPLQVPAQIEAQLLQREFRWRAVRLWQLATTLLASTASVSLAWRGAGPFALLAGVLIEPVPLAVLLFASRCSGPLRPAPDVLRRMHAFGWPMVGGSLCWKTRELLSSWAVGLALGAADLGLLNRATGLTGLVIGRFSAQVSYAVLPVLARVHGDPRRRRRAGVLLLRATVWSTVPLAVALVLLGELAVDVLYGEAWSAVVPLLLPAAALALLQVVFTTLMPVLLAGGRTRERLVCDLLLLAATVVALPALLLGLRAWIVVLCCAVLVPTIYILAIAARDGWIDRLAVRESVLPPVLASAVALLPSVPARWAVSDPAGQIASAALFALVFVPSLRCLAAGPFDELVRMVPGGARLLSLLPSFPQFSIRSRRSACPPRS